jgi:hypothetical protein
MQMTLLASIIILISVFPQSRRPESNNKKTAVELWCVGDDLLSQRMCQAFFAAFESSPDFDLQEQNKSGNLIVNDPRKCWLEKNRKTHQNIFFGGIQHI